MSECLVEISPTEGERTVHIFQDREEAGMFVATELTKILAEGGNLLNERTSTTDLTVITDRGTIRAVDVHSVHWNRSELAFAH